MKICHVITRLIIGGAQENTLLTCLGLHGRGHQVTLITGPETGPEGSMLDEAANTGYELQIIPPMGREVNPVKDYQTLRRLTALLRKIKPDVVHTHTSKAGILGRLAAHHAGVPTIIHTIHGMSFNRTQPYLLQWFYRQLERYCARRTDRLITVADAMRNQAVAAGVAPPEKFITVYSGMRMDLFAPDRYDRQAIRQGWSVAEDEIVVGTVARLFRNKGYEALIPAMARATGINPKLRFVWIGDGAQRHEYERQLESLGLRARVIMTGLLPPHRVPEMIAGMDMLVHASQWEGLPRAATQTLLMERPVISFDIDGAPEVVIPGRTGILVPLNDISRLAEAIIELAANPNECRRLGCQGRQLCIERFDARRMVDQLEQIYVQACQSSIQTVYHS